MEAKHFSHQHPLILQHVVPSSLYNCSGCKSPASGNVYVCYYQMQRQCRFYLHEQCFHAPRSLKHPSHPLHPLTLAPSPTHPSSSFLCDTCNLSGHSLSYTCSACDFDLHLHCALMHNPIPLPSPSQSPPIAQNFNTPLYPPPPPPQIATLIPNHMLQQNHPQSQSQPTAVPNQTHNCTPNEQNKPPLGYPQQNPPPQSSTPAASADPPPPPPPTNKIKHFSHPHNLKQMEFDGEGETPKICSACEVKLSGSAYCCTQPYCTFSLDKGCFDAPREVQHKSHPAHSITLLTAPPGPGSFMCDACRTEGKAYAYTCSACNYDLHIDCIRWPEMLTRPYHDHPLALRYGSQVFDCGACGEAAGEKGWAYCCKKCDFGVHVGWCVNSEIKPQPQSDGGGGAAASLEEELLRFQMQKMNLDFQMQMAKQQAEFMASIAHSWNGLV